MSATPDDASAKAYFRAIESAFIRLRGAPLLLSPEDFQTVKSWHEEQIPLSVVCDVLESVFERVHARDPKRRVSSLRYCAPAVEQAWQEIRDLSAAEGRLEPDPIDVPERLESLAASLPAGLAGRRDLDREIRSLTGSAEAVEKALQGVDRQMLDLAEQSLDEAERAALRTKARSALDRTAAGGAGRTALEDRLFREFLRRRLELPTLSLFASQSARSSEAP